MAIFSYVGAGKVMQKIKPRVDSFIFHLHYRLTFLIFLVSSLLVTAKEYVGAPIMCDTKSKEIKGGLINTYCYVMSTFSLPSSWNKTIGGSGNSPYPGVAVHSDASDEEVVFHTYYLWVPIVLFLQAICFYIPHFMWKKYEGGVFQTILGGLNIFSLDGDSKMKKYKVLTKYMMTYLHEHQKWAAMFFLCEALNLVNVIGQIYFTNLFLGGTFLTYGTDVINYPETDSEFRVDPMARIFPKMAKCTFRKFGSSGTMETHDAFCLLAVNIINEKIYIFVWFWMVALAVVTALWLVYRLIIIMSSSLRNTLLEVRGRMAGKNNLKVICEKCNLGDWFLVYQLGCHMEPLVYGEFLKEFAKELESSYPTLERKPMLAQ